VLSILSACKSHYSEPVTLTFLDPEWSNNDRGLFPDVVLQEFTRQTGIRVQHLPAPETDEARIALIDHLLKMGESGPDLYSLDVIWPGMFADNLVDLGPYFQSTELTNDPAVKRNFVIGGKLLGVPYHALVGALYYRADLLQKYGYTHPPRTWNELETMASRIQQGERTDGKKDFWGFVWPGATSEGLLCNALEWQGSEGGGQIIEPNQEISVNNPAAIRSWERAKGWIGRISPPATLLYQEPDTINTFAYAGNAAFLRGWTSDDLLLHPRAGSVPSWEGVTSVPGSTEARTATLGGSGLAVSKASTHRSEAIQLIHFLLEKDAEAAANSSKLVYRELYELPDPLKAYPRLRRGRPNRGAEVVVRPSSVVPRKYDAVASAYARAVHSVLTGQAKGDVAAAELEDTLRTITGFQIESKAGAKLKFKSKRK